MVNLFTLIWLKPRLPYETSDEHPEQSSLDELSESIKTQLRAPQLRN
uniref:Heat shock protein HspQ n=1 Tax=Arsenophonus endosymbiont of Trialeurodes vaporariorum TaxID=235567 RepID=A0A3B0M5Z0_9GAMM